MIWMIGSLDELLAMESWPSRKKNLLGGVHRLDGDRHASDDQRPRTNGDGHSPSTSVESGLNLVCCRTRRIVMCVTHVPAVWHGRSAVFNLSWASGAVRRRRVPSAKQAPTAAIDAARP